MNHRALVATATLVAVLGFAAPAGAWQSMATCSVDEPVRWLEHEPIRWRLSSTFTSDDLSGTQVRSMLTAAWQQWDAPHCSDVGAQNEPDLAVDPFDDSVPDVVFGFYEAGWPPALGQGLLALTRITWDTDTCLITGGDIAFNGTDHTWIVGTPQADGRRDLQSVATHEIGHLLGLDHTEVAGSTMSYPYGDDLAWRSLGCDDTAGICGLYPSGDTSCVDSAMCPCGNPCVDGICQGMVVEEEDSACWSRLAPGEEYVEVEPNDDSTEPAHYEAQGGDVVIQGSLHSCGNDGAEPTGDVDWLDIDAPCEGRAWVTLEPTALDADVDLFVYVDGEIAAHDTASGPGEPAGVEVELGNDFQAFVDCWEGSPTEWTFRVDYLAPGEQGGFAQGGVDCGCSAASSDRPEALAAAIALLLALGLLRGRRPTRTRG